MQVVEKKPTKIYINSRFLTQYTTGVQRYAQELVKALDVLIDRGEISPDQYKITLLAPTKGLIHDLKLKHIPTKRVGILSGHAWEQLELPIFSRDGLLFCPGNTAPFFSLFGTQKTVVSIHGLAYLFFPQAYSASFRFVYNMIIPWVLRYADAVITVAKTEKSTVLQKYPFAKGRIHSVHNGGLPNDDLFVEELESLGKIKNIFGDYLLFVGSMSKGKNLQGLLDALRYVKNEQIKLVIVGNVGRSFAETQLKVSPEIARRLEFIGHVSDPKVLAGLYQGAKALVFPSFYEGFGIPPLEAMACGCPVIVSDAASMPEVCMDAALYCNPYEPKDIAEKINIVLSNSDIECQMRGKGLLRARTFTWKKCASETFKVIKEVADKG